MNSYYDWLLVFIAIFVPPVSVLIKYPPVFLQKLVAKKKSKYKLKQTNNEFYLSFLLFFIGYLPSLIHALYLISKNDEHYRYFNELKRRYKQEQLRKKKHKHSKSGSAAHRGKLGAGSSNNILGSKSSKKSKRSDKNPVARVRIQESTYGSVV